MAPKLSPYLTASYWTLVMCIFDVVSSFCVFFFFQAEDGIRDLTVTGVQTCALPISGLGAHVPGVLFPGRDRTRQGRRAPRRLLLLDHDARGDGLHPCDVSGVLQ